MKQGIYPRYQKCTVTCISCGNTLETESTLKEIRVDACSNCTHSTQVNKDLHKLMVELIVSIRNTAEPVNSYTNRVLQVGGYLFSVFCHFNH